MTLARPEAADETSPRKLLALAIPTILLGACAAGILWVIEKVADQWQQTLWDRIPDALGVDPSGWWIILVLTLTGLAVGLCLQFFPGHGGPDSATTELIEEPLHLSALPGVIAVTILALGGGVSLGPENPIIAVNVAIIVFLLSRLIPAVPSEVGVMIAGAATVGALFGTPVAAALIFTEVLAAIAGKGSLWDKLFLPLVAAGSGTIAMKWMGGQHLGFNLPAYGSPSAPDLLYGILVACAGVAIGLAMLYLFSFTWRALHSMRSRILIPLVGGLILGILGFIGGPITMFKGLAETGQLLADPAGYSRSELTLIIVIKALALAIAASALFRGGRIFPATFLGVAVGLLGHAMIPNLPLTLAVACGVLGVLLVVSRDGWLALFVAVAIPGDITVLPVLCVVVLPAWLLVTRQPEFRIMPEPATPAASPPADAAPEARSAE
ncbi:MAG: ion channel protein [Gordonia sp. (in: high G+C Gram-positive bacteria)]|uniref:ion channel protein n=1 Tax=Gordonia sp. (in: high G+C Gram-positive bacteria) TaxID=84139 RepID=UPI003BB6C823